MSAVKTYTLKPRYPRDGDISERRVVGFREAINEARRIAAEQYCRVTVRNEADQHTWHVDFRVRCNRRGAGYTTIEVTR